MLLEIRDVHVHYHKVAALKGIDMEVPDGGIVTIIGANGAGKSTTLRAISGLALAPGSLVGTTGSLDLSDGYVPLPGACAFYQVYGRHACSGASEP